MTPRKSRSDWLESALVLLQSGGPRALTIDRVCRAIGRTKGGFYHHFGDAAGLRSAILDDWERRQTSGIIEAADRETDLLKKAELLDRLVGAADWAEERAIRAWGWHDTAARVRVAAVDARRIDYLTGFYPHEVSTRARQLATLEYAALIGAQHLFLDPPDGQLAQLLREALTQQGGGR